MKNSVIVLLTIMKVNYQGKAFVENKQSDYNLNLYYTVISYKQKLLNYIQINILGDK